MLVILSRICRIFLIVWWSYCIVGTYKLFNELRNDTDRNRASAGILAEVILLISNIIKLITI